MSSKFGIREQRPERRCPFCHDAVETGSIQVCPGCKAWYHAECWEEFGGCTAIGCTRPVPSKIKHEEETLLESLMYVLREYLDTFIYLAFLPVTWPLRQLRKRRFQRILNDGKEPASFPIEEDQPPTNEAVQPLQQRPFFTRIQFWFRRFFWRELPPLEELPPDDPLRRASCLALYQKGPSSHPWPIKDPHLFPEEQIGSYPSKSTYPIWYRLHLTRFFFTLLGKSLPQGVEMPEIYSWIVSMRQAKFKKMVNFTLEYIMVYTAGILGLALIALAFLSMVPWWSPAIPLFIAALTCYIIVKHL